MRLRSKQTHGKKRLNPVRLSRADFKQRINGEVAIRFDVSELTSFVGLELIGRFFRRLGLRELLHRAERQLLGHDFGPMEMPLVILTLLDTGDPKVPHIGLLKSDRLVNRVCGLGRAPSEHTVWRWPRAFDRWAVDALLSVNERLASEVVDPERLGALTPHEVFYNTGFQLIVAFRS